MSTEDVQVYTDEELWRCFKTGKSLCHFFLNSFSIDMEVIFNPKVTDIELDIYD